MLKNCRRFAFQTFGAVNFGQEEETIGDLEEDVIQASDDCEACYGGVAAAGNAVF